MPARRAGVTPAMEADATVAPALEPRAVESVGEIWVWLGWSVEHRIGVVCQSIHRVNGIDLYPTSIDLINTDIMPYAAAFFAFDTGITIHCPSPTGTNCHFDPGYSADVIVCG